ncbi:MAG TPA: DUF2631 domain-containing protein [Micromonosporaceae bacterium]|nr:DUF2631 domain-containing protein [Micromonosporaceae bacterium]
MAGNEPVTAPDQHKRSSGRAARAGAVVTIVILLLMLIGNHQGNIENLWLVGLAALLTAMLVGDWVLRRSGLRS